MKRFITLVVLSLAVAIGTTACAHAQLTNQQLARASVNAASVAAVVGLVIYASSQCRDCNISLGAR